MTTKAEDYKGIRGGTSKATVRKIFDEKGADAAIKKAEALGLQISTARTWCSVWRNEGGKKVAKKVTEKVSKGKKAVATKKSAAPKKALKPSAKKTSKKAAKKVATPDETSDT